MIWGQRKIKPKPQNLFPDIMLQSERIFMRPPMLEDWQEWASVRAHNKDRIQPFEPQWSQQFQSEDLFERRIHRQAHEWELGRANAFLIFKNRDQSLIGGVNINNICRGAAHFAAIGYWVDKEHEGQGYMSEALGLTLEYCFEMLQLHRVNASCLPHNTRSKNTLLKAGFKEEGFAEKYLEIDGKWQDHILFGLPIENWPRR